MEEFVKRLKELRKERKLTQLQLANATRISVSAISAWENNTRIPSALAIIELSKFFEVTSDYLLGLSDI